MGKLAAQKRHRHQAILKRDAESQEYYVAASLRRFVDRGRAIVHCVAHFVWGCGLDEIPNRTAHGGTVVDNKESGPVHAGHWSGKLLRLSAQSNTDFRIFPSFYILYSLIFVKAIRL